MHRHSVLVVDDDPQTAASLGTLLSNAGFMVLDARNNDQALKQITRGSIDYLVTKILMADGDGIELIMAARAVGSTKRIVALSDRRFLADLDLFNLARKLGADAVVELPSDPETLLAAINLGSH